VVLSYWRRRALRLLPAFAAANLLMAVGLGPSSLEGLPQEVQLTRGFAFGSCPASIWRNLLFLTNLDFSQSCGKCLRWQWQGASGSGSGCTALRALFCAACSAALGWAFA